MDVRMTRQIARAGCRVTSGKTRAGMFVRCRPHRVTERYSRVPVTYFTHAPASQVGTR